VVTKLTAPLWPVVASSSVNSEEPVVVVVPLVGAIWMIGGVLTTAEVSEPEAAL
jgi:hypothetical protein